MDQIQVSIAQQLLIGEALKHAAHQVPNREAFVDGNKRLTYSEVLERATQLSGWLQEQGISRNDKVGCLLKNGLPFVELYFSTSLIGAVFVPVNFRLASQEIEYIVNHSDIKILVIEEEFIETILPIVDKLPQIEKFVIVGTIDKNLGMQSILYDSIFDRSYVFQTIEELSDNDAHTIIYTSGTTGKPKGAVLTHKNLYINGMNKLYHTKSISGTKHLVIPPFFHVAALSLLVQTCLMEGTIHIHREFEPIKILETIQREKINSMFLVPAMWNFLFQETTLLHYDLSSMTNCSTGGAICPVEVKKRIMSIFKNASLHEAFGQTEMSPSTTYLSGEDSILNNKTDSVGKPSINVRVRIVDGEMNDVPLGEVGEIVYQGPTMMKEYYKNTEATKDAFRGGWFHSGDLV